MKQKVFNFFQRVMKGDEGEYEVLEAINRILQTQKNYFLVPKAKLSNGTSTIEVDLILLHPSLGLFVIEVKNWSGLESVAKHDPYEQVHTYKNILLGHIEDKLGKVPINVEYRVIFPQIEKEEGTKFFHENPKYAHYQNHTLFQEDLKSKERFQKFFYGTNPVLPNKKEFLTIASIIVDKKTLQEQKDRILPVITNDEILFFDLKQLSILNGFTGGFRIIRGVAGTGKTVILTNYVANRAKRYPEEKFLVLCFNARLKKAIEEVFDTDLKRQVAVLSLFELLKKIDFDFEKVSIGPKEKFDTKFEKLKSEAATKEFREKFRARLQKKPIDLFLCDETQDMPPNFLRIIYEEIGDAIFFIDEGQKFYTYSMDSIAEVFHHPNFEKLSMRGRVKNLKNVYRTPSNIARCAFEILAHDISLNAYYKKSAHYLQNSFLQDINFILEDGNIIVDDFEETEALQSLVERIGDKEIAILTHKKDDVKRFKELFPSNVDVYTFQSIKGLESDVVVLHNFDRFLEILHEKERELLFRKVYVLLTRAKQRIYISLPPDFATDAQEIEAILKTIEKYRTKKEIDLEAMETAKLMPKKIDKEKVEIAVLATEVFAVVAGFFA